MERGERGAHANARGPSRGVHRGGQRGRRAGNNLYRRRHVDLLGGAASAASGIDARADRYRTTASEVSATAEEVRWEEENSRASEGSGLSDMASMRDAIKSASRTASERTTRSRSHLSSHVGIIQLESVSGKELLMLNNAAATSVATSTMLYTVRGLI